MQRPVFWLLLALVVCGGIAALLFLPPGPLPGPGAPIVYDNYDAAIADIKTFDTKEQEALREECQSIAYHSGKKEAKSVILLHGYTNCPKQFAELGERLHAKGYNVLIPRAPGHGHSDRMTDALEYVTAADFTEYTHRAVAIGNAMGDDVTLMGLSGGGTLALWASIFEPDVDQFIAIAPVAYPRGFDPRLRNAVIKYAALRPSDFRWWNEEQKNDLPGPPHAYRRYSTRSMGVVMHMASTVEQALAHGTKVTKPVTFVINEADKALLPNKLVDLSNIFETAGAPVTRHIFMESEELPHDLIDAYNIKEHKEYVYNVLISLIP